MINQKTDIATIRVALAGYGQMGKEIERCAPERNAVIAERFDSASGIRPDSGNNFDVAIEFTRPDAAVANITTLIAMGKPVVVGTTGWLDRLPEIERLVRERNGRLIHASNFSIGVNIFLGIVAEAGRLMNDQAMYDAAVHEIHHVRKADSPSGTALSIASVLLRELDRKSHILAETSHGRIEPDALHLTSQRLGATVGTHAVLFDSEADTVELTHRAKNRSGFALGALLAARWIIDQPSGVYRFEDIFRG
ncbi:MAG: Dihydrodipicolinate reductase [Chlorobi bacterium]|nr:Dihydrodipicolinate reductase [Chlorobiota bacterium]